MGHGIVLNRIVPYYGSGKKLRHTIGHTGLGSVLAKIPHLKNGLKTEYKDQIQQHEIFDRTNKYSTSLLCLVIEILKYVRIAKVTDISHTKALFRIIRWQ